MSMNRHFWHSFISLNETFWQRCNQVLLLHLNDTRLIVIKVLDDSWFCSKKKYFPWIFICRFELWHIYVFSPNFISIHMACKFCKFAIVFAQLDAINIDHIHDNSTIELISGFMLHLFFLLLLAYNDSYLSIYIIGEN